MQEVYQLLETNDEVKFPNWVKPIIKERCSLYFVYRPGSLKVKLAKVNTITLEWYF